MLKVFVKVVEFSPEENGLKLGGGVESLLPSQVEIWEELLLGGEKELEESAEESGDLPLLEFNPLLLNEVDLPPEDFSKEDAQLELELSVAEQGVVLLIIERLVSVKILNEELHFIQKLLSGIQLIDVFRLLEFFCSLRIAGGERVCEKLFYVKFS